MSEINNIILIGMQTAGKSTVGKMLAKSIGYNYIDEDDSYESIYGPIHSVKETEGIDYYINTRKQHIQYLSENMNNTIISTGGETGIHENISLYNGFNIYIRVNSKTLNNRFNNITNKNHPKHMRRELLELTDDERTNILKERDVLYINNSHLIVNGNRYTEDIVHEIICNL